VPELLEVDEVDVDAAGLEVDLFGLEAVDQVDLEEGVVETAPVEVEGGAQTVFVDGVEQLRLAGVHLFLQHVHWLVLDLELVDRLLHRNRELNLHVLELVDVDFLFVLLDCFAPVDSLLDAFSHVVDEQAERVVVVDDVALERFEQVEVDLQALVVQHLFDGVLAVAQELVGSLDELGQLLLEEVAFLQTFEYRLEVVEAAVVFEGLDVGHLVVDIGFLRLVHDGLLLLQQFGARLAYKQIEVFAVDPLQAHTLQLLNLHVEILFIKCNSITQFDLKVFLIDEQNTAYFIY